MPSLDDVAKSAKVSISTASRVLNGTKLSERISLDCATRVREAARAVGYIGGYHRRAIRSGKTETLGVVVEINSPNPHCDLPSALSNIFHSQIIAGVEQATHSVGYNLSLIVPSEKQRANVRGAGQVSEGRVDGLVILPTNNRPENTIILRKAPDLPIAAISPVVATDLPSVLQDFQAAVDLLICHLFQLGHRHLLYFGPKEESAVPLNRNREVMFRNATAQQGITGQVCVHQTLHQETAVYLWDVVEQQMSALDTWLHANPRSFTAIVCFNDMTAVTACRVLARHGLRVPGDVSVTGIDNVDPTLTIPTLTTIDVRLLDLGFRAARIVLDMIEGGETVRNTFRGHTEVLAPRLFVRDSTGPVTAWKSG